MVCSGRGIYLEVWNLLDFPAGIVHMGYETGKNIPDKYPLDACDSKFNTFAKKVTLRAYFMHFSNNYSTLSCRL
jgi:hypothetical protein